MANCLRLADLAVRIVNEYCKACESTWQILERLATTLAFPLAKEQTHFCSNTTAEIQCACELAV